MNGYDLTRAWFDFCFDNPEKISPNHTAIYCFAIEHCNRLGWRDKFGFPTMMACDAVGIKKASTYMKYFNDLVEWGFFDLVQKSANQYSANIISLTSAKPKNGKALDKAIMNHRDKHGVSTGMSKGPVDKPLTTKQLIYIPPFIEFKEYALSKDELLNVKALEVKYNAWVENNWKDGNDKKIKNWKSKLLHSIPYIEKNQSQNGKGKGGFSMEEFYKEAHKSK